VLSHTSLVLAYGLCGLNFVLVPLLAHWRLAEPISGAQIAGMALIAAGVGLTVAGRGPA
jgi:drug/metabolite transporter (DMT)-like permease